MTKLHPASLLVIALAMFCAPLVKETSAAEPADVYPVTVGGRAIDSDGRPIQGAVVFLVSTTASKELRRATTLSDGRYEFRDVGLPLLPPGKQEQEAVFRQGNFQVFGKAPGYAFSWRGMKSVWINPPRYFFQPDGTLPAKAREDSYLAGEKVELDLTFSPPWPVRGRFVDEQGTPLAGVRVRLANCDFLDIAGKESHRNSREFWSVNQAADLMPEQVRATTNVQGGFELPFVPPGMICWLMIEHADFAKMALYTATADPSPDEYEGQPVQKLPVELRLAAVRTILVEVRHPETGAPVPETRINASQLRASGSHSNGTADAEGRVTLKLPPGPYQLGAEPPRRTNFIYTSQELIVKDSPPEQIVSLKPQFGCVVILKALDADTGAGIPGVTFHSMYARGLARVVDRLRSNTSSDGQPQTDEQGQLSVVVNPGKRWFSFNLPEGYQRMERDTRDREANPVTGRTETLEFRLRKIAN